MKPFDHLLPETLFETVTAQGLIPTGTVVPLNSYENRVYEIALEDGEPIVAKYYRPGRWSLEAIAEEHRFVRALDEAEIPVVRHLTLKRHVPGVETVDRVRDPQGDAEIYYAFFPKFRGRAHDEITNDDRLRLGRTLARAHNVGDWFKSTHRVPLTPRTYGYDHLEFLRSQPLLPEDLRAGLEAHLQTALEMTTPYFEKDLKTIPLHGDCHPANILWNKDGPHLLDFDDMVLAPPVQDLWMLFYGESSEKEEQQRVFFEGYEVFRKFDRSTLVLIEPLRTLRMIRHAAWIGQRFEESAFQIAFPFYRERRYWEEFLQGIREQIALLQELSWS